MPEYDIIIPHYGIGNLTELCLRCLESIRESSRGDDYRIVFVDNGSPEFDKIAPELERHPYLLIRNCTNLGFIKAVNEGLAASSAPFVVLLNNDTEAVPGWLPKLRAPLTGTAGLCGPRTTTPNSWQGRWTGRGGAVTLSPKAMLAFFCVMIRREVISACGYLDEDFGIGFGDDDMYCHVAQQKGWRLVLVQDLVIPHHHRSTFQSLYSPGTVKRMQQEALRKFFQKRGGGAPARPRGAR